MKWTMVLLALLLAGCSEDHPVRYQHRTPLEPGNPGSVFGQYDGMYRNGRSWILLQGGQNAALISIGDGDFRFHVHARKEGYVVGVLMGTNAPDSMTTKASLLAIYDPTLPGFHAGMQFIDLANPNGHYVLMTLRKE